MPINGKSYRVVPGEEPSVAKIEIQTEEETGRGWVYLAGVELEGRRSEHTVRLAWVDHELWSGGRVPPSRVVESLLGFLIERGREVPAQFDAAAVRRWFPDVDQELPGRF
jgi:hypothetical protein